jgi:hypothetical protein
MSDEPMETRIVTVTAKHVAAHKAIWGRDFLCQSCPFWQAMGPMLNLPVGGFDIGPYEISFYETKNSSVSEQYWLPESATRAIYDYDRSGVFRLGDYAVKLPARLWRAA